MIYSISPWVAPLDTRIDHACFLYLLCANSITSRSCTYEGLAFNISCQLLLLCLVSLVFMFLYLCIIPNRVIKHIIKYFIFIIP